LLVNAPRDERELIEGAGEREQYSQLDWIPRTAAKAGVPTLTAEWERHEDAQAYKPRSPG
jgi:hypothetical protein